MITINEIELNQDLNRAELSQVEGGYFIDWSFLYRPIAGLGGYAGLLNRQWAATGNMWTQYNNNWLTNFRSGW